MFEAAVSGSRTDEIEGVEVVVRPALTAAAVDVLEADGYLLGTPVQLALGILRRTRAAGKQPSVTGIGSGGAERHLRLPGSPHHSQLSQACAARKTVCRYLVQEEVATHNDDCVSGRPSLGPHGYPTPRAPHALACWATADRTPEPAGKSNLSRHQGRLGRRRRG
jgi:hypothetical protein